ncbi:ATP-binding protein [Argonema galeatum]|uniref:ATP-binding protein n=1 Tax=Argonema galeatum TaxID=2942762 RepID=UPI0020131BE0|nr:ATP-binding protein [Argonema galeatum]MCL1463387.1 ATP-binding protein [Argonema galeatum A003/A1]
MSVTLNIPTVNDELKDFDTLFQLWQQVGESCSDVTFDFSKCFFLKPNAVAFLGGLIRFIQSREGKTTINKDTLNNKVKMNLQQNGFMYTFCEDKEPWQGNSVPYREDAKQNKDGLVYYLAEQWLGRDWVQMGQNLRNVIVGRVWEIYANAFEHGRTDIGVFSCGQHYPKLNQLKLTVVDFGVGIPSNVRQFQNKPTLPVDKALEWAFQAGTSTRQGGVAGGVGLDYLKKFVKINRGKLEFFSQDGYVAIDENQEIYQSRQPFFQGTLVNITLQCEEALYILASDADDEEPLF